METRAHHVLIGVFTLVVFAMGVAFVWWLSSSGHDRTFTDYDVVFHETVTGLTKGSAVQYNGIAIGEVVRLQLDPDDPRKVVARIRVTGKSPLKIDTQVRLGFAGITGVGYIQMSGGTPGSAPVTPEPGKSIAVIEASASDLSRLRTSGESILLSVNDMTDRMKEVLTPENTQHLASVLRNTDEIVASVNAQRGELSVAVRQLSTVTDHLYSTLDKIDVAAGSFNGLVTKDAPQFLVSANKSVESINRLVADAGGLVRDSRTVINGLNQQGLRQVGPTLDELRGTLGSLQRLSDQLTASDSALLGNPQPRAFRPR